MAEFIITADSKPKHDGWGFLDITYLGGAWETYWDCSDWITWHKELIKKYGKEQADNVWAKEYDNSSYASHETICSTGNQAFKDYAISNGLNKKSTILTKIYRAENVIDNIGAPIRDIGSTVRSTTQVLKIAIPILLIATTVGLMWYGYKHYIVRA